jgi:enterochelin esterase-like enzyme
MRRRDLLGGALGLGAVALLGEAWGAAPSSKELEVLDLQVEGDRRLARRALVLVPKGEAPPTSRPMLVLLHGLGETGDEVRGIHAWASDYGLVSAVERLSNPPVGPERPRLGYFEKARAGRVNAELAARPFEAPILVCPVTPNAKRHPSVDGALDAYAKWLVETLLPAVAERVPSSDPKRVGLDGCSLGGYVALETFLRRPQAFVTLGGVQAAFGLQRAPSYADRLTRALAECGEVPIHLETSTGDPFRRANERLGKLLGEGGIPCDVEVLPGPHDQPWLREVGTLAMLHWQSRKLVGVG